MMVTMVGAVVPGFGVTPVVLRWDCKAVLAASMC